MVNKVHCWLSVQDASSLEQVCEKLSITLSASLKGKKTGVEFDFNAFV